MLRARYYAATSLLAAEPAGETALCLLGIDLDSGLCVGSGITDLLVKGVNGTVKLLVGLLSVLIDVLLCVGAVRLELGVELAGLFAGILDLERVLAIDNGVVNYSITYGAINLLTNLLAVDLCLGLELLGTSGQLILC